MKYHKANWKYKLEETEDYQFPEPLEDEFTHHFLALDPKNELCGGGFGIVHGSGLFCVCKTRVVVRNGYAWDGPCGADHRHGEFDASFVGARCAVPGDEGGDASGGIPGTGRFGILKDTERGWYVVASPVVVVARGAAIGGRSRATAKWLAWMG